jgi:ribosome recycling factor
MSEDDQTLWESEVQDMTNDQIKRIDEALAQKQEEIMQV